MALYVFVRLHARENQEDALSQALAEVVPPTSREPDCLEVHAYRSTADPRLFYIHSRWKDEAAFDLHATLPHTVKFIESVEALINHPFQVTRANVIV
jgi:quinol monooxygenase YgiN